MDNTIFLSKQTIETLIIKDGDYRYMAECTFVKNGKKQIWRYASFFNKNTRKIEREYGRVL